MSQDNYPALNIAEQFYSVQGEGATAGVPAYFVRLANCNLMCGGTQAKLVRHGQASWWCDTEDVWKRGTLQTYEQVTDAMYKAGQLERIADGLTHVVWTGGEPLLPNNQRDIKSFMQKFDAQYQGNSAYHEVETNGTQFLDDFLYRELDQINCSPKLGNSGMPKKARINERALERIRTHYNPWFKFVVGNEEDIEEMERDYVVPLQLPSKQVILMPAMDKFDQAQERSAFVYEMAKKYGYRASLRGHIIAWDKKVGV